MIEASIRKLGPKPEDVKLLLTCHAHIDHVGGHAYIEKISGAQVAMIDAEKIFCRPAAKLTFTMENMPSALVTAMLAYELAAQPAVTAVRARGACSGPLPLGR